jgi:hypothetical protein
MPYASSFEPVPNFTVSIRTIRGPLTVHVKKEALFKLGAIDADEATQLRTLDRHMPRFHALALQLAARATTHVVAISAADVWWNGNLDIKSDLLQDH